MNDHKAESVAYTLAALILSPGVYYALEFLLAGGWLAFSVRSVIAGVAIAVCGVFCYFLGVAYFRYYNCEVPTT